MKNLINRVIRKIRLYLAPPPDRDLAKRYPEYQIGCGTYGDLVVQDWNQGTTLTIGAYTSIASGVKIFLGGEHRIDWVTTYPFNVLHESAAHYDGHPKSKGNVYIGNDVWIGTEAFILSGVTIGDGVVVGARALVSRDVPPYAVVVGNPAKVVKYRFDEIVIDRLLEIKWWNWSEIQINRAMSDLLNSEIETFLRKAEDNEYK